MDAEERDDLDFHVMVEIKIYKNGYMSLTSDDVPGLTLGGMDYPSVCADLIPAITYLQVVNGSPRIRTAPKLRVLTAQALMNMSDEDLAARRASINGQ